jgi:hypothetical protein
MKNKLSKSKLIMYSILVMTKEVRSWDKEECESYLQSHDEEVYTDEYLATLPFEEGLRSMKSLIIGIEGARIQTTPIAELVQEFGDDIDDMLILDKVSSAIHNDRLNLEKGSRDWYGLYLDITPLVWARNFADGYDVDVYEYTNSGFKRQVGELKLR